VSVDNLEYRLHVHMKSGNKVSSDFIPAPDAGVVESIFDQIAGVSRGDVGVLQIPVSENMAYLPYSNIEYLVFEYVIAEPSKGNMFSDDDHYYGVS
jgi:hypothetical protein